MRTPNTMLRMAAATLALVAMAACTRADYIEIEPDFVTFRQPNNSVWLRAHVKAHSGEEFPKSTVSWSVKDPSIAQVDDTGKLTPVKSGRTEVEAKFSGISASIPVEVLYAEKMQVEPTALELKADGEPVDLKVKVYDYRNRELRDRSATFKSLDPKILSMGQNSAHPGDPGETKVEVRVDGLMQVVNVKVKK